jgi:hypothetical protein
MRNQEGGSKGPEVGRNEEARRPEEDRNEETGRREGNG